MSINRMTSVWLPVSSGWRFGCDPVLMQRRIRGDTSYMCEKLDVDWKLYVEWVPASCLTEVKDLRTFPVKGVTVRLSECADCCVQSAGVRGMEMVQNGGKNQNGRLPAGLTVWVHDLFWASGHDTYVYWIRCRLLWPRPLTVTSKCRNLRQMWRVLWVWWVLVCSGRQNWGVK